MHFSVRTSVRTYVQPELLCAQLLLHPLMDFVHIHTQWPTWHGDDCKHGMLQVLHELWDFVICFTIYHIGEWSCVRNSSYTILWILFIPTHSGQHDMKMKVKIEFYDAASFTWVMGLCHRGIGVLKTHF